MVCGKQVSAPQDGNQASGWQARTPHDDGRSACSQQTRVPHTIVFDLDGTIHDTMRVYEPAFNAGYQLLADKGLVAPHTFGPEELRKNIGLTVREAWARLEPDLSWEQVEPTVSAINDYMLNLMVHGEGRLYEGVAETLDAVCAAGHRLVLLSNCGTKYKEAARAAYGLDRWFSAYFAAEDYSWEPKERIFEIIRTQFEGPYIAVGDRYKDIALAGAHDLACVGCLYGFGTAEELSSATALASHPSEIAGIIEHMCA